MSGVLRFRRRSNRLFVSILLLTSASCLLCITQLQWERELDRALHTYGNLVNRVSRVAAELSNFTVHSGNDSKLGQDGGAEKVVYHDIQKDTYKYTNVTLPYFVDSTDPDGPGENGTAVILTKEELESDHYKETWSRHHFNEVASERISVYRSLPQCATLECQKLVNNFQGQLSEVSVIIVFHNEAWSTLLRTVHSVLRRTPDDLLREIILVDDDSIFDHLKAPLDKYFSDFPKVKIIRSPSHIGLTQARLLGFNVSTAPVIVFLDAHVECFPGWLQPLLIRIYEDPKAVVYPVHEIIYPKTFELPCTRNTTLKYYCTFSFQNLQFKWVVIPVWERDRRSRDTDTYMSPTMPGGLFAISRDFFVWLGTYDPELGLWGGENIELAFKTWMCGGSIQLDPCSHVGHVFRQLGYNRKVTKMAYRNAMRVAEVWMDDYKNHFFEFVRKKHHDVDFGDVSSRKALRQSLGCHSFGWYLSHVCLENLYSATHKHVGQIVSVASSNCLDVSESEGSEPITAFCQQDRVNQSWIIWPQSSIQLNEFYLCVKEGNVVLSSDYKCFASKPRPYWFYDEDQTLHYLPTHQCLTAATTDAKVFISPCDNSIWQKWNVSDTSNLERKKS